MNTTGYEARHETLKRGTLFVDETSSIDVTASTQRYGDRLTLNKVEWVQRTQWQGRRLHGPSGRAYWIPALSSRWGLAARPAHVYCQFQGAFDSFMLEFEVAADAVYTACDLLNLAFAAFEAEFPTAPLRIVAAKSAAVSDTGAMLEDGVVLESTSI